MPSPTPQEPRRPGLPAELEDADRHLRALPPGVTVEHLEQRKLEGMREIVETIRKAAWSVDPYVNEIRPGRETDEYEALVLCRYLQVDCEAQALWCHHILRRKTLEWIRDVGFCPSMVPPDLIHALYELLDWGFGYCFAGGRWYAPGDHSGVRPHADAKPAKIRRP